MSLSLRQLGPCFAAEASGIDITQPITSAQAEEVHAAMTEYAVVIFREQPLTDEAQMAFTLSLGPIEPPVTANLRNENELRIAASFADVSNLDENNKPFEREDRRRLFGIGNRLWHSDSSFKVVPAKYSLLHARTVTSKGGDTEFADMRAAYEALDDETKMEIDALVCEHSQMYSRRLIGFGDFTAPEREKMKPVRQALVRTHPDTGRKSLYLASHAGEIVGWPTPEAMLLLSDLTNHATQREFVYRHQWRNGDLVIWDNRRTMHRARPFPPHEPRDVRRTTLAGEGPTAEQAAG
ncbi:MAG: alpha-ketoglutarate-dependent 2,4-dichlorophenoxyacetate dioxygenase [Gammaproteobacteria bacterium]|jgi:alpha-ketoglutarate-dependent 2,4-dichlorophenoxyacetate dioxygenase